MDELKQLVLSTIDEIEKDFAPQQQTSVSQEHSKEMEKKEETIKAFFQDDVEDNSKNESEVLFLESLRERLLVLFEGLQAPNNNKLEAKVDLLLNFLEYTLASIDKRIQRVKKG